MENADPLSFVSLEYGYAKDKNTAWYLDTAFTTEDLNSLTILNRHFAKDIKAVYIDRKSVEGIDGNSFELLSDRYEKDAVRYYYYTPVFDGKYDVLPIPCNYESFEILDYQYAKDQSAVFFEGNKIPDARSSHFELIAAAYSRDDQNVYFRNIKVNNADPASFATFTENENSMGETVYAKDKNSIFINENQFAAADVSTYRILNEKYTLDKNSVYYKMKKMKNADQATFTVFPHFIGDADAEDKHHRYGEGKVVE